MMALDSLPQPVREMPPTVPARACDRDGGARARWHVVETQPHAEFRALRELADFRCHLPTVVRYRKLLRHGRPVIERGRAVEEAVIRPFFPGYLFVRFDPDAAAWAAIPRTPGVKRLLCSARNQPLPLPNGEVERWMAKGRAGDGAIDERAPAFPSVAAGDMVRITAGPLTDMPALVQLSDRDRVVVLLAMLGAERPVTLYRGDVERV